MTSLVPRPRASARQDHDVIVLGAGVNGAGIARDCALRGLQPLLVDKNDLAKGASGANTGMIHGGIRYLRYDIHTTKMSCLDSGYIQRIAPHLLFRVPFLYAVPHDDPKGRLMLEAGEVFFAAYDKFQPLKGGKPHTRLTQAEALKLEPGLRPDIFGAVSMDEWGIDPFRLVVENVLDAAQHGAAVRTYCDLESFIKSPAGAVQGVVLVDRLTGAREEHRAPVVINATGAWGPRTAALAGAFYELRPGKGVHLVYSHRISNYGLIMNAVDGRQVLMMPHENGTIVGTTDDDYYGDLDNPKATEDEVKGLLQAARDIFPGIDKYRVSRTYVGIRPTLWAWSKNEDRLSREHAFYDHTNQGVPGLVSVAGGKLAAYRQLAHEVTDLIAARLGNHVACTTHERPLPGAAGPVDKDALAEALAPRHRLAVGRLAYRHGARAKAIVDTFDVDPRRAAAVCLCEPVCEGEVRAVVEGEHVRRLSDVRRRTRLSMGACGGTRCLARGSQLLQDGLHLSAAEQLVELEAAMTARFIGKRPVLQGSTLATEELNQAMHFLTAHLGPAFEAARAAAPLRAENPSTPADAPALRRRGLPPPTALVPPPVDSSAGPSR